MTTAISDSEALRRASLRYLWMHNRDWTQMAEEGEPQIIESGNGVRVIDSDGNSWIDVNGGYNSVNVGYGREEIGEAAYEQMASLHYFPQGTTTVPMAKLAAKLAEIAPGSLSRVFPVRGGSEANETALKIARAYHKRTGEPG
ncbi:MAG: aminotransferase class III-fold pyridoxal phosphate-dependent enzyme, partial [Chloroflexi bacterium]|nr:aminotransferase class III-fold pyridoxal phosphate-dependent enzyme [Chloroflexota bacterium]